MIKRNIKLLLQIQLGENPWILIVLIFLELLLILIPGLIASKIEKRPFKEQLKDMGFRKNVDSISKNISKILAGLAIGFLFFLIAGYILFFFKYIIVENILGTDFIREGESGAIRSEPIQPNFIQLVIIVILHITIIGICEEAFFRGFIINKCEEKLKSIYVTILSAFIFAIYHVPPFLVPIRTIITLIGYFFTFGVLLALVFFYFNHSLIPCCIAHSTFNILVLIF
jgi:membrane protease YdiL (CAAX protease family)